MEFLYGYGLFLAKAVTLVVAIVVVVAAIAGAAGKQKPGKGHLEIVSLTEQLKDVTHYARSVLLDKAAMKKLAKQQKKDADIEALRKTADHVLQALEKDSIIEALKVGDKKK